MMIPDALNSAIKGGRSGPLRMISRASPPDPDPAIQWKEFSLTAGDSGDWLGFSSGDIAAPPFNPPVGAISGQPAEGIELEALYQDPGPVTVVVFMHGFAEDLASTLRVSIDGVELGFLNARTLYGMLRVEFSGAVVTFVDGVSCAVKIYQAES